MLTWSIKYINTQKVMKIYLKKKMKEKSEYGYSAQTV